jgi:hypothetical protein
VAQIRAISCVPNCTLSHGNRQLHCSSVQRLYVHNCSRYDLHFCSYGIVMRVVKTAQTRVLHVAQFLLVIASDSPYIPRQSSSEQNQVR